MPKRKIDDERTRRYPHLSRAIRYMESAPRIDPAPPRPKKKRKK